MRNQHEAMEEVRKRITAKAHTFADMQAGTCPLTNEEIEKLIRRNPATWLMFRGKGCDHA